MNHFIRYCRKSGYQKLCQVLVKALVSCLLLSASNLAFSSDLFSLGENPEGKTTNPPVQLESYPIAKNSEQHYAPNQQFTLWVSDELFFKPAEEDQIEIKKVLEKETETFKLENKVPAIGFKSGIVNIPDSYVEKLRVILDEMKNRSNVRLHFIGHSDSDKLSASLQAKYVDNIGLSRSRAQIAAEYFQRELDLPPDGVSFDGVGDLKPIASNDTAAGRRKNRRVEIQVWYDVITQTTVEEEVVVAKESLNRLKVCRRETVCKLTYKKGSARRSRLQHLVNPLRREKGQVGVPAEFIRQINEAYKNLKDKQNVTIHFVGHTDNLPLDVAEKRIYDTHINLSKARARYIALEVQGKLALSNRAISSGGKGFKYPLASNGTAKGRSLNQRIEVEFWYDDPFEHFTDEPQACPESAASETVTLTYDPLTGPIAPVYFKQGQPIIPTGYSHRLSQIMDELKDRANVRLSFTGYTNNERLNRRTAAVYGDDLGLSRSRARRTMELIQQEMKLSDEQVEYDGRGFVHSEDVVRTGFVQFDTSRVEVKVIYDELAVLEDQDNINIERIDREALATNPYAINLMRITVDGEPLYDPSKNSQDIQRCTDVALDEAKIQFKFNNLHNKPRLNITALPTTIRYQDNQDTPEAENKIDFKMYSNYTHFIDHAEVRIFNYQQSTRSEPLAIIPIDKNERAFWKANFAEVEGSVKRLVYLLRVYASDGNFDETVTMPLWVVDEIDPANESETAEKLDQINEAGQVDEKVGSVDGIVKSEKSKFATLDGLSELGGLADMLKPEAEEASDLAELSEILQINQETGLKQLTPENIKKKTKLQKKLLAGYGENQLNSQHIKLVGGTVTIKGENIPEKHNVWLAGKKVPVNAEGEFVSEELFPRGMHTIEVAVLDKEGNGELFLRDLAFAKNDWFYVALGDVTVARDSTTGPARLVTQDEYQFNNEVNINGRFAYYVEGIFANQWKLTSSADTLEGPVDELFSNFLDKNPRALLRRLDPDIFYPTFGDDSTLEERAATSGKLFVRLQKQQDYAMLGNFTIGYLDTTLAQIDRGLYGTTGHYESDQYTSFGEQKFLLDGFAAEPGTLAGRDEFRSTGGSLYFMRHQDILIGSDRLRIEVRDKDSGIVIGVKNLVPVIDYDLDYIQGRILLSQPLASFASDGLLVSDNSLSGNPVYLVSRYEYTTGFDEIDTLAFGLRTHYWFGDLVKLGLTSSSQTEDLNESSLDGLDLTIRKSTSTWLKLETASSVGAGANTVNSNDGGFNFSQSGTPLNLDPDLKSKAYRVEANLLVSDMITDGFGRANFYMQQTEAGFNAPGQLTTTDVKQMGGRYNSPIGESIELEVKFDSNEKDLALKTASMDVAVVYQATEHWAITNGARSDSREDNSVVVPETQKQGDRIDLAVKANYDSRSNWTAYSFAQSTVKKNGNREKNERIGVGGSIRTSDDFVLDGEVSTGEQGVGAKLGTDYKISDKSNVYSSYSLDNARSDNGIKTRRGNWNSGMRSRFTDTVSVYGEERYTHGDVPTGLTHAFGIDYVAGDGWDFGATLEAGTLKDNTTGAQTERQALGLKGAYNFGSIAYSIASEYRIDDSQNIDTTTSTRTTWLIRNNLKYQMSDDWRIVGKANFSESESSLGESFNGDFQEIVVGYGYRPVENDRLNALFKYTYFYNLPIADLSLTDPLTGQVVATNTANDFIQKSHILSLDFIYDLTQQWSIGAKYAYRLGELAQDRTNPEFFESKASLYVVRADWHFTNRWDAIMEVRLLDLPDAQDRKSGVLLGMYRHLGNNVKIGVGYNFTDFSDDLTDLDFNSQGIFINFVGKL